MSKKTAIRSIAQLRHAAQDMLAADALLRWRWKGSSGGDGGRDAVIELRVDGGVNVFDVEFKLAPSLRDIERLSELLEGQRVVRPKLLIAPAISETLVQHCRERGINCLDLNGRQWIRTKGLVVDRVVSTERRYRAPVVAPDVFQPKSSRLVRTLLSHPARRWTQGELGHSTGLSPGLVSRLVRHLVQEGFLDQEGRQLSVARADALLDAWAARDDWGKRTTVRQYSLLEPDIPAIARKLAHHFPPDEPLVFTQWFAAHLRHPYTVPPIASAYVKRWPAGLVERHLHGREVAEGGTLWLVVPEDEGVFLETQRAGQFVLACDVQIYLDLWRAGLRGEDQAKVLRGWAEFRHAKA